MALHGGRSDGAQRPSGLIFQVDDAGAACSTAAAGGAEIVSPPELRTGEPIVLAEVADPEGNLFSFSQYVG